MSDIGIDLKDTYEEIGTHVVFADSVSGEWIDSEPNSQVTKPFIREFFLEATFPYDTEVDSGTIVTMDALSEDNVFIVMNKTAEMLENEIIQNNVVLYKCNVTGKLYRQTQSGEDEYDSNYRQNVMFNEIAASVPALQTEPLFGNQLDGESELGLLGLERHELFVPSSFGIKPLDRFETVSGEYYMVETVEHRRYKNVCVCKLGEDHR